MLRPKAQVIFLPVQTPGLHTFYLRRFNSALVLVSVLIIEMPHLNAINGVKLTYIN